MPAQILGPINRSCFVGRAQVRLWQALCMLIPVVPAQQAPGALDCVLAAVGATNPSNVKQYQENIAVQLLRRYPSLFEARVVPMLRDYSCK